MSADSLDHFLPNILTQETRKRIQLHEEIVNYLQNPCASVKCEDLDRFLDGIANWIVASNFKISLSGLEVVSCLIDRMGQGFQVYIPNFLPLIVDRLADNKEQVRSSAQDLLVKLMTTVSTPQFVFERLTFAFSHKSPKVKEEMLSIVQRILQESGTAKNVGVSKLVPHVIKLLEDPNIPIRELTMDTLCIMYQYVGERLRRDIMKKDVTVSKMGTLLARFDEVKNSGLLKLDEASSRSSSSLATRRSEDELDRTSNSSAGEPGSPRTPGTGANNNMPLLSSSSTLIKRVQSTPTSTAPRKLSLGNISSPMGVDEESFTKSFSQVPKVSIYSAKDFTERFAKVKDILADQNLDWNKRVDALKEVRAWLTCSSYDVKGHPEFNQMLVTLEPLFHATVRDLRSQVVRETCITVAYLSQELGKDFSHFAETILPPLVTLIPNSAKVMATSSMVTIKFILQNTHNHKLIPIVASNLSSKSNVIRRQCCEFLSLILQNWATAVLEKQLAVIQDMIKKGMTDADSDARLNSRKAFWNFSESFKSQADQLLQSLDSSKQRQLLGEQQGSSSSSLVDLGESGRASSTNGIASATTPSSSLASQARMVRRYSGASTNHDRTTPSSGYGIRRISKDRPDGGHATSDLDLTSLTDKMSKVGIGSNSQSNRSHQALYGTLRKSKAYSSMSSSKQSQASSSLASSSLASSSLASSSLATSCDEQTLSTSLKIARPRKSQSGKVLSNLPTPTSSGYSSSINSSMIDRGRSRSRVGVSQSQPSSRSSSPAPRLSYITQIQPDVVPQSMVGFGSRRRSTTGLNKSREGSRDSSPNRSYGGLGRERRPSGQAKTRGRNLAMQRSVPGEDFVPTRTKAGASSTCDSDDVNSETSSVCSDGSSYWNCGRQVTEDTSEIIACLSSGSWSDRRDGLIALQHLLNNNRTLSRSELKKVTDIFSRMFHDPHGKVFSVFMETLSQLVIVHHGDMHDWLYILMTRLLAKTGADLLGSTQAKIQRTLDTIRSSFPTNQQFMLLAKLLIDQTQSPNLKEKVKVAMLCYLHGLTQLMSSSDFVNTSDVRLAISRIITWTTEPKSVDVRKAAQAALLSLHALNQSEFELIMSVLPKTFQEGAERILQNRSHHSGQSSEAHSLKDPSSPISNNGCPGLGLKSTQPNTSAPPQAATSDEIYDSIRQTSEDIHALVRHGSAYKRSELPIKSVSLASTRGVLPGGLTVESRIPSFLQNLPDVDIVAKMAVGRGRKDSCNGAIQSWFGMSSVIKKEREEANKNASDSQVMLSVPAILQELSHHNERNEERKSCLLQLMKKSREESTTTWDEYFNTVLLILLETLADSDGSIRALSLRVLSEFLRCHPQRFHEYVELTVVRSLEAHKDTVKEVTRAAEECSNLLSRIISPERSHVVLGPLIESEDFPINLAAVKMMTQIVEEADASMVIGILPQITPSLLKAYDNNQSSVRKSSVICLVAVYMVVGEEIRPYLQDLHGSKVKLLNVYIKRALDQQAASSCGTSKTSSPTSVIEA